jgi:hypothetical protein
MYYLSELHKSSSYNRFRFNKSACYLQAFNRFLANNSLFLVLLLFKIYRSFL